MLLTLLWDDICEPIWKARCNTKHSTKKISSLNKMSSLAGKLMWYHRHQDEVLNYRHRFLVDYTLSNVKRWTRITRTSTVAMLDNTMGFYKVECGQLACCQSTIYDWMSRHKQLRSGQLIGEGLTDVWDVGQRPTPNDPLRPTQI